MVKINNYIKKKKNKIYSPYLSIYKPQFGNIISILESYRDIYYNEFRHNNYNKNYLKKFIIKLYILFNIFFFKKWN